MRKTISNAVGLECKNKLIKTTGFLGGYQHVFAVVYADT